MSQLTRFVTAFALIALATAAVTQITDKNLAQKINQSPYTLIYFYSSACNYCKEFTPVFEKLAKNQNLTEIGVDFAKIDGPAFQNFTHSLHVYSYPSVLLYRKGVSLPVHYRRERKEQPLLQFIQEHTKLSSSNEQLEQLLALTPQQRVEQKVAIFYGKADSLEAVSWDVIARRDGYITWALVEQQQPRLVVGEREITDFSNLSEVEEAAGAVYARLHEVTEESWLKMMQKKILTIFYFNKQGNKKTKKLLSELAQQLPEVNFIQIDGEHEEYKPALRALGVHDQENILAVDRKYDVLYVAPSPYTLQGLHEFIGKAKEHKLQPYRKTEKTEKLNKLTRDNYEQKMGTPQDVLLFLYEKSHPKSKDLMSLFEYLVHKLKHNTNLLLLRCDVGLNEVEEKLGFVIKPTPKIVFFRNRMKNYAIHYTAHSISTRGVIDFIMENTTFDFEDEWAEL